MDEVLERAGAIATIKSPELDSVRLLLEKLLTLWAALREETERRQQLLDATYQVEQYYFDVAEVEAWLSEQELFLMNEEKGKVGGAGAVKEGGSQRSRLRRVAVGCGAAASVVCEWVSRERRTILVLPEGHTEGQGEGQQEYPFLRPAEWLVAVFFLIAPVLPLPTPGRAKHPAAAEEAPDDRADSGKLRRDHCAIVATVPGAAGVGPP